MYIVILCHTYQSCKHIDRYDTTGPVKIDKTKIVIRHNAVNLPLLNNFLAEIINIHSHLIYSLADVRIQIKVSEKIVQMGCNIHAGRTSMGPVGTATNMIRSLNIC